MKRILLFFVFISMVHLVRCSGTDTSIDMGRTLTDTNAPPVNLAAEIIRAKSENKLLLLEFASSDSCPPCILFQQHVFSTPQFEAFAKSNLDFVRLDFPLKSDLRPDTVATNNLLAQQFGAFGFPTFVALDRNGKELWRMPQKDNPDTGIDAQLFEPTNFINLLAGLKQKK